VPASDVGSHKKFLTEGYNFGSAEYDESMAVKV
jgi:hypothetical protein